jgi:hypothetical protein
VRSSSRRACEGNEPEGESGIPLVSTKKESSADWLNSLFLLGLGLGG